MCEFAHPTADHEPDRHDRREDFEGVIDFDTGLAPGFQIMHPRGGESRR